MNKILHLGCLAIVLSTLFACCGRLEASHIYGTQVTYACLNPCTTRVYFTYYNICAASPIPSAQVVIDSPPGCTPPTPLASTFTALSTTEITPVCPGMATDCTIPGASITGWWATVLYKDYDICAASPCTFGLRWNEQLWPGTNTVVYPNIYYRSQGTLLTTGLGSCNNSPVFTDDHFLFVCDSSVSDIAVGAIDPDGDSLVYRLDSIMDYNGAAYLLYSVGFSPTAPMGPNWTVSLDPQTGILHVAPNPGGIVIASILVHVDEYRNGTLIGAVERILDFTVRNCSGNLPPALGGPTNLSGGMLTGNTVATCQAGTPICFDITGSDANPGQNLTLTWSGGIPGATFTQTGNITVVDTVHGTSASPPSATFCWPSPAAGTYHFRVRMYDDQCPYYAIDDAWITLEIAQGGPPTVTVSSSSCPMADFDVTAHCGPGPFTYLWSGSGGLSGNGPHLSHTYVSAGNYTWQLIASNGATTDTLSGTVAIGTVPTPQSLLSGLHFVAPCTGNPYDTLDAGSGWNSYVWSNGDTTQASVVFIGGTYQVTVSDPNGCLYYDSTTLYWVEPDLYGVVTTSLGAALQNQRILLVAHDTLLQTLTAVDSAWTDSLGYYFFCNVVDSLVTLKATPLAFYYPNEMPTYADTTLFWNNALWFYPFQNFPLRHDFATLFGANPGGPGFIGGLITQGANKTNAVGDPVPGLRVFLREVNGGAILGHRVTNANGYFSFAGIPFGDYEIVPDRPLVSTTNVPALTLTAQTPVMDSLDFQLHRYWLELVAHPNGIETPGTDLGFSAFPNPFDGNVWLRFRNDREVPVTLEVYDVVGRKLSVVCDGTMKPGEHALLVDDLMKSGMYLAKLKIEGEIRTLRIVKQ